MKKSLKLSFLFLSAIMMLSSCVEQVRESNSLSSSIIKSKAISYTAMYDYGFHIPNKATILLNSSLVFFDCKDYGIDAIYGGDEVTIYIEEDDEIICRETYPSSCYIKNGKILDVSILRGRIIEFNVGTIDDKKVLLDNTGLPANNYEEINIIENNEDYHQLDSYDDGTKIYGVNPSYFSSLTCVCFYNYRPY